MSHGAEYQRRKRAEQTTEHEAEIVFSSAYQKKFWSQVNKNGPMHPTRPELGKCWIWIGQRNQRDGYAQCTVGYRKLSASRIAFAIANGRFLKLGFVPDHTCNNGGGGCVRPEHLEEVTQPENMRRWAVLITRCKSGHEFTPENTQMVGPAYARKRRCKKCAKLLADKWRDKNRAYFNKRAREYRKRLHGNS